MFGRRKDDEDPFAALKDGGTYQSAPAPSPDLGLGDRPRPPEPARRRRSSGFAFGFSSGLSSLWRVVVLAIVSVVIGSVVLNVSHSVRSIKIPSFTFNTGGVTTPTPGGTSSAPRGAPARPVNYLTPRGLQAGLARIRRLTHGAKLTLLRIDATTLSVYATRPSGTTSHIYVSPAVTFASSAPRPGERPIAAAAIRPSVLGALVAQLKRRFGVARNRIDYMVLSTPPGLPASWVAFVKNRTHQGYMAPLSGGAWKPI